MRRSVVIVICAALCAHAFGQGALTLDECKELALENNVRALNAGLALRAAKEDKKEAFTKYFPSVSMTGGGVIMDKAMMTTEVEDGGGKAAIGVMQNNLVAGVMASQPLYAGGQIVNANRLAALGVEVSRLQGEVTREEVVLETERYFWQLVALKEKINTIGNARKKLAAITADVTAAVEAGLTVRNDILRVELEDNRLESNMLKATNGLRTFKMAFAQHMGLKTDSFDIEAPDLTTIVNITEATPDIYPVEQKAEYQLLDKSVEAARLQRDLEIGKHLPTVAIGAGYSHIRMDIGKPAAQSRDMSLLFASLSIPVTDWWGGSHAVRKKKLDLRQARNTRDEKRALLTLQRQQIRNELSEAYLQVIIAQKSIASATENLRISEDSFSAGITILSDLLDAQTLLQQSHDLHTEATTTYLIKLAAAAATTGHARFY
ncbi:MAG: TolC family protein [Tannerellaceae bacterium]|jgi:outer membrane protein TolC|nr:TolC family protein [Tannerellaceae bacterium]